MKIRAVVANFLLKKKEEKNELQTFRIDSTYSNENYISDGLTNSELFKKANEFLKQHHRQEINWVNN